MQSYTNSDLNDMLPRLEERSSTNLNLEHLNYLAFSDINHRESTMNIINEIK